tara:strand:- start:11648 stop:12292 length:645 start_codon:yes stop_codon:yes gene_type:complete
MADNKQICILCRGSSMSYAAKYFHDLGKDMIIVNEFNEELKNDFVARLFEEKDIVHMVSRDTGLSDLRPEYYRRYNITKAVLNIFEDEYNKRSSMRNLLEYNGLKTSCLPNTMKPFQKEGGGFPTTGIISIVYSTIVLEKKDIHIAGMDFYEKDYYVDIKANDHQKRKGMVMKNFIEPFMQKFPEVNYTFYTNSSFKSSLNNAIIVNEQRRSIH